jgi:hypothetical protein
MLLIVAEAMPTTGMPGDVVAREILDVRMIDG